MMMAQEEQEQQQEQLFDWIRAASPLAAELLLHHYDVPCGAPVCAADDPDVEKVYRTLAYWCIDFSAAPLGFIDNWFRLPRAQRAELTETVGAFRRELHPDTCLASAAERDDPTVVAACMDAAEEEEQEDASGSRKLRRRLTTAVAAARTKTIAILARAGAVKCLRRVRDYALAGTARDDEIWLGEALAGGSVEAVEFLVNTSVHLRRVHISADDTFWVDYAAMSSGSTVMLDWLYAARGRICDRFRAVGMHRLWEAACAATVDPVRFAVVVHWIEARAGRTYRTYFAENFHTPGARPYLWSAPIRTDNVAALDWLQQHCGWDAAAELAMHNTTNLWSFATRWRVTTTTTAATTATAQELTRNRQPRPALVWLVARAREAGVRMVAGYAAMARHGGLAALRWLRAQNIIVDWSNNTNGTNVYSAAVATTTDAAAVPATIAMIDWLVDEGCPLTLGRRAHLNDPFVTVMKLPAVGPDMMCAMLDRLLAAAAHLQDQQMLPDEYARSLAMYVFLGCVCRRASNGRPEGTFAPTMLDWICRHSSEVLAMLQTDPILQSKAAANCMLNGNLAAAQWLLDVAGVPPSAFCVEDMFSASMVMWTKLAVAPRTAVMRWITTTARVTTNAAASSALVAALESGSASPVVVRWLLRKESSSSRRIGKYQHNEPPRKGEDGAFLMASARMGRAAIVASSLPALQRVFRAQKAAGACTAWRSPVLLARLAGRYARPTMLRWLYTRKRTEREFGVQWHPEALVIAALNERDEVVRWFLRTKYSLRTRRDPAQVIAARQLCLLLREVRMEMDAGDRCRRILRQWMCRFFDWTEAEAEERVLG